MWKLLIVPVLMACRLSAQSELLDLAQLKSFSAERVSSNNADPASNDDSKRPIPGETLVLADLQGPGVITHIWLTIAANEYGWPRLLRFRVYYDGSATASVDAPVGDFFGVGHGQERPVHSIMVRDASNGRARNSYWPMPFRKSCRITITNEGRRRVSNVYYHVDWKKVAALPPATGYFHAYYKQELPAKMGQPYEILRVNGRGQYVGTVLNVVQAAPGWFGEGDDLFYIDGEKKPSIQGTGTEDYFNDAWSLRIAEGPYTGVTVADGTDTGARLSAYRWHVPDPIPFQRSLRFVVEHAGWTYNGDGKVRSAFEERGDLFSSVAFWYQQAGETNELPEPPYGAARLPHGNAQQIEVENAIAETKTEGGTVRIDKDVFWSRDLLSFQATGPGSKIEIPFSAGQSGKFEIVAQIAHAPNYGSYRYLIDGKPAGSGATLEHEPGANMGAQGAIDAYFTEMYVAEDHLLGWHELTAGRHVLTLICTGKDTRSTGYDLGVDTLILAHIASPLEAGGERAANLRRASGESASAAALKSGLTTQDEYVREAAAWAFTQREQAARQYADALIQALRDPDAVVRGLSILALSKCVGCAEKALQELTAALQDSEENVRLAAADAIATIGAAGAPAVPQLIEACNRPGEHVHVLRSLAKALGNTGAAAAPAIPALEKLQRIPRVEWPAREAIKKITAMSSNQAR
ncbi:MAG TPA: DUF2961 domain-containing protein [Bryobacteraceae bacterium]